MAIRIGNVSSIGYSNDLQIMPDDRQELVRTVNNNGQPTVTVEDYGVVQNGEVISLSAVFSASDYNTLLGYWSNRTLVNVTLDDNTTISNARIVVKGSKYFSQILNKYKIVQMEIWRI